MAIVNRALDASEQKRSQWVCYSAAPTGATLPIALVPSASELDAVWVAATGLSGAPTVALTVNRFIAGAGFTTFNPGSTTLTLTAFGTSGAQSMLVAAPGSTLVQLLPGDVLSLTVAGANSNATNFSAGVVLKALQDIKTQYGV